MNKNLKMAINIFIMLLLFVLITAIKLKNNVYKIEYKIGNHNIKIQNKNITLFIEDKTLHEISFENSVYMSHILNSKSQAETAIMLVEGNKKHDAEKTLHIFQIEKDKLVEGAQLRIGKLNPWKLSSCDVNGDGIEEIVMGAYKESPFHKVLAKRPFLYDYIDGEITPKWRGSRLTHPFEDFTFLDVDGDGKDEILSLEYLKDGSMILNTYRWMGFGFDSEDFIQIKIPKSKTITKDDDYIWIDKRYYEIEELSKEIIKGSEVDEK